MKMLSRICDYHRLTGLIALAVIALVFCGCQQQLMPTPNLYLSGATCKSTFAEVPAEFCSNEVDVLYVTDRKAIEGERPKP